MTMAAVATSVGDLDETVQRARGDAAALGRLYDRYSPGVFRYCVHRLFSRQVAEDVTAEVFLHAARQMHAFGGRCEQDFRNWLYAVATNQINAYIRSARRRKALLSAAVRERRIRPASTDACPQDGTDWADLYAAIAKLSARDQAIVTLRGIEGLPFEQVAAVVKMKSGAVRMAFGRALKELRERLSACRPASRIGDRP